MSFITIWVIFAVMAAVVAGAKDRSVFGWLLLGFVFGVFALLLVAALPSLRPAPASAENAPDPRTHVLCPDCKEPVRKEAIVCRHCGAKLIPSTDSDQPKTRFLYPHQQAAADRQRNIQILAGIVGLALIAAVFLSRCAHP